MKSYIETDLTFYVHRKRLATIVTRARGERTVEHENNPEFWVVWRDVPLPVYHVDTNEMRRALAKLNKNLLRMLEDSLDPETQ